MYGFMSRFLPYLLAYVLPSTVLVGLFLGGFWTFLTPIIGYIFLPILDFMFGHENENTDFHGQRRHVGALAFRILLWGALPTQVIVLCLCATVISSGALNWFEIVGLICSAGISSGAFGITVAHELVHKRRFDRKLARILLWTVGYAHFCIEHVQGHHVRVGTYSDPATARLGESIYAFFPRSILGGWRSAWKIEAGRLSRRQLHAFHHSNRIIQDSGISLLLMTVILLCAGPTALIFLIAQAAIAILELEIINYIEHYGLYRREISPGQFEEQQSCHSWTSGHHFSNWALFNLPRHADHHDYAGRPYYMLRNLDAAPQLPAGYSTMLLLAIMPWLWKKVMDPIAQSVMHDSVINR